MKDKWIFLVGILFFLGCKSQEKELDYPIIYKSPKGGIFDMLRFKGKYSLNEVLTLNKDSTYVYKMCAQLEKGKWFLQNDTLTLYCNSRIFHIDSLNYIKKYEKGTICPELPNVWQIKRKNIKNVYNQYILVNE